MTLYAFNVILKMISITNVIILKLSISFTDVFLPSPESLLVNLGERRELVKELLTVLPQRYSTPSTPASALGAALQAAYKLMVSHYLHICFITAPSNVLRKETVDFGRWIADINPICSEEM